ncbi:MAG: class I SAM-dependent methyltransferase [Bacteroidales bacterium]|nr:class I SAM-dependent methyltransferase [Bacteroidales bacterium]
MANTFEYPDTLARFYDVIYHSIRDHVDSDFFLNTIREAKGPVLEIGVGTGRFFASALQKGADIYGIDISKSMVEVLKKKLNPEYHSRVTVGDACYMKLKKKFNLIIAPFRVFSHVTTVEEQLVFLNNVWGHLNEGGKFIFDLFVPDPGLLHKGVDNVVDFEGEYEPGKKLRRISSSVPDIVNQLLDVTMRFEWQENDQWNTESWSFKMRFYFRYELEHLIRLSKLKLLNIYGDYAMNGLNRNSKEFILVCGK